MAAKKGKKKKTSSLSMDRLCTYIQIVLILFMAYVQFHVADNNIVDGFWYTTSRYGLWVVILVGLLPELHEGSK